MARSHQNTISRLHVIGASLLLLFLFASCGQSPAGQTSSQHRGTVALTRPSSTATTYVAIGASDTFGIGADDPYSENWASDLAQKLGSGYHLVNLGIPGITVHDALSEELPVALDAHPRLVTIWLAVNDLATGVDVNSYSRDLNTLLSRLQADSPRVLITMANVPDLTLLPYFSGYNTSYLKSRIQAYNAAIASIAKQHHVVLVNLAGYDLKNFPEYISNDGLHPSTVGYLRLAELFYNALQASQGLPKHT